MAARVSFTICLLTVTNKSLHLENHFVDVSTALLHKMYSNNSQVYLESLKTQKNQTFSRDFFIILCSFCNISIFVSFNSASTVSGAT